eukprot:g17828.t1
MVLPNGSGHYMLTSDFEGKCGGRVPKSTEAAAKMGVAGASSGKNNCAYDALAQHKYGDPSKGAELREKTAKHAANAPRAMMGPLAAGAMRKQFYAGGKLGDWSAEPGGKVFNPREGLGERLLREVLAAEPKLAGQIQGELQNLPNNSPRFGGADGTELFLHDEIHVTNWTSGAKPGPGNNVVHGTAPLSVINGNAAAPMERNERPSGSWRCKAQFASDGPCGFRAWGAYAQARLKVPAANNTIQAADETAAAWAAQHQIQNQDQQPLNISDVSFFPALSKL